jgi:hypothetical protein
MQAGAAEFSGYAGKFRCFQGQILGPADTLAGHGAIHMIRQGQALGTRLGATVGLHRFMVGVFELAV